MTIIDHIAEAGHTSVFLGAADTARLKQLHHQAMVFFDADETKKLRYSTPRHLVGYRPFGHSYAYSPEQKSLDDSFLYWPNRCHMIEHRNEIAAFLQAFANYLPVVERIIQKFLATLSDHYDYQGDVKFEEASFLQINSYTEDLDNELLQQPHEDRVLLTVIWAAEPGLHLLRDTEAIPVTPAGNEVVLMPGSILTAMTGGQIQPTYHYVRNHGRLGRKSVMYFVSPDPSHEIQPYIANNENMGTDIRELSLTNPRAFGLPPDFLTA